MLQGKYQFKPDPPFTVGMDLAGVVDVARPRSDTPSSPATASPARPRPAHSPTMPSAPPPMSNVVPDAMPAPMAAAYPCRLHHRPRRPDRARQASRRRDHPHPRPGGVGMAAIDVARMIGARIIATTASSQKVRALKTAGAHDVIVLGQAIGDQFRDQVKALTNGRGADVIYDSVAETCSMNPRGASPSTRPPRHRLRRRPHRRSSRRPTSPCIAARPAYPALREYCRQLPERGYAS